VKALLEEMIGPPDGGKTDRGTKKREEQEGKSDQQQQQQRPHVKVMILNSGNVPMFLNMMCSARQAVRFGVMWMAWLMLGWMD
jgi:hypothetical protein